MQRMPFRGAALVAAVLLLGALSGCATTKSTGAVDSSVEEEEVVLEEITSSAAEVAPEVAKSVESAPMVVMCYLGVEFGSETLRATTVRIDVDGAMMTLVGAGDKTVAQFTEGVHGISIAFPKASTKKRKKSLIAVELKPFVYTKILIEEVEGKKSKNRLIVRVLEDGEEVHTRTIEL